jgi:hypothetical protein
MVVDYCQLIYLYAAFEMFTNRFENVGAVCFEIQVSRIWRQLSLLAFKFVVDGVGDLVLIRRRRGRLVYLALFS